MDSSRGRPTPPPEAGFALIEVLISAMIACIAAVGIAAVMQTTVHSASVQRNRSQAYALGQEDQARLRTLRIPVLRNLTEEEKKRLMTIEGVEYTIASSAAFVSNGTSATPTCATGQNTADYLSIQSEVTWANMSPTKPIVLRSIVAPPSGTLAPNSGMLAINVSDGGGNPVSGVGLSGTGAGTFSGTTDTNGCAIFLEQTAGKYTLTFSGAATNLVDQDGVKPTTKEITVNPETTTSLAYTLGSPGSVKVKFQAKNYTTTSSVELEKLYIFNSGMPTGAKSLTFPHATSYTATSLFPFTSSDSIYSSPCINAPSPAPGTGIVTPIIPAGTAAPEQTLTMPALLLTVQVDGTATNNVPVKIKNNTCGTIETPTTTENPAATSTAKGRLAKTWFPWANYTVCAWTTISGTKRYVTETFDIKAESTSKTFNIRSTPTASASPVGECP